MDKIQNKKNNIKFSLITLVLTITCSFLIVIATFTQLNIYTVENWNFKSMYYIPQIPVIMFIAGLLEQKYGTISVIIYILTGLFLVPVFALGGGLDYILNFNFGYILAYIPAVYFSGLILSKKQDSLLQLLIANFVGVLIIHIIGIIYLTLIFLIENESMQYISNWIINQSLRTVIIDIIFGYGAIITGNFIKRILKKIA